MVDAAYRLDDTSQLASVARTMVSGERVVAAEDSPLRTEFCHRHVPDGYGSDWQAAPGAIVQMVRVLIDYADRT